MSSGRPAAAGEKPSMRSGRSGPQSSAPRRSSAPGAASATCTNREPIARLARTKARYLRARPSRGGQQAARGVEGGLASPASATRNWRKGGDWRRRRLRRPRGGSEYHTHTPPAEEHDARAPVKLARAAARRGARGSMQPRARRAARRARPRCWRWARRRSPTRARARARRCGGGPASSARWSGRGRPRAREDAAWPVGDRPDPGGGDSRIPKLGAVSCATRRATRSGAEK